MGCLNAATFVPTALPYWDTQAIIENLADAYAGFPVRLGQPIALPASGSPSFNQAGFEKTYRCRLLEELDWLTLLERRARRVLGEEFIIPMPSVFVATIRQLRPLHASNEIATLCNGWHTSHRMHERIDRYCLFGCVARDSLSHYVDCPTLMAACHMFCPSPPSLIPNLLPDSSLAFRLAACNSRVLLSDTFHFMSRCKLIYNTFKFNPAVLRQASGIAARLRTQFSALSSQDSSSSSSSTSSDSESQSSASCGDSALEMHELILSVARATLLLAPFESCGATTPARLGAGVRLETASLPAVV